jgi:hypothetical protein
VGGGSVRYDDGGDDDDDVVVAWTDASSAMDGDRDDVSRRYAAADDIMTVVRGDARELRSA